VLALLIPSLNVFTSCEGGANAYEPPFAVLRELGQ
jgi:hypothetical protein